MGKKLHKIVYNYLKYHAPEAAQTFSEHIFIDDSIVDKITLEDLYDFWKANYKNKPIQSNTNKLNGLIPRAVTLQTHTAIKNPNTPQSDKSLNTLVTALAQSVNKYIKAEQVTPINEVPLSQTMPPQKSPVKDVPIKSEADLLQEQLRCKKYEESISKVVATVKSQVDATNEHSNTNQLPGSSKDKKKKVEQPTLPKEDSAHTLQTIKDVMKAEMTKCFIKLDKITNSDKPQTQNEISSKTSKKNKENKQTVSFNGKNPTNNIDQVKLSPTPKKIENIEKNISPIKTISSSTTTAVDIIDAVVPKKKSKKVKLEIPPQNNTIIVENGNVEHHSHNLITDNAPINTNTDIVQVPQSSEKKKKKKKKIATQTESNSATQGVNGEVATQNGHLGNHMNGNVEYNSNYHQMNGFSNNYPNNINKNIDQYKSNGVNSNNHETNGIVYNSNLEPKKPFRRIDTYGDVYVDPKLTDNSFEAKHGDLFGQRANDVLKFTKGKSFKHEKTKKKRGSYGGTITMSVNSVQFNDD